MWEIFVKLREAKGVTDYEVAKACGFHQSAITRWKKGISTPNNDKLQRIADYFGVPIKYLTSGDVQTLVPSSEYSEDVQKMLTTISSRPDIKQFIEAAADAAPEDVLAALDVLLALKRKGLG